MNGCSKSIDRPVLGVQVWTALQSKAIKAN